MNIKITGIHYIYVSRNNRSDTYSHTFLYYFAIYLVHNLPAKIKQLRILRVGISSHARYGMQGYASSHGHIVFIRIILLPRIFSTINDRGRFISLYVILCRVYHQRADELKLLSGENDMLLKGTVD